MLFFKYYNSTIDLINSTSVLKPKRFDYLQLTFCIINGNNASLLSNIINKSYALVAIVWKFFFKRNYLVLLIKAIGKTTVIW